MNATEAEASAEYFLPFFTNILLIFTNVCRITLRHKVCHDGHVTRAIQYS